MTTWEGGPELCPRCGLRPGVHPRWWGGASTRRLCAECQAASLERAAAWTPGEESHLATWRCWAIGCTWSTTWTGSAAGVRGEVAQRIARDTMREHAQDRADEQHAWVDRQLGLVTEIPPSQVARL